MEKLFTKAFNERSKLLKDYISDLYDDKGTDIEYEDIVKTTLKALFEDDDCEPKFECPDFEHIVEVDHGHYQGTLVYLVPERCYQPDVYWLVKIDYGSCSGCDTLQAVLCGVGHDEQVVEDLYTLAVHIVQRFKEV